MAAAPFHFLTFSVRYERNAIQLAVADVVGVTSQDVKVIGFALSDELSAWLKQALEDWQSKQAQK